MTFSVTVVDAEHRRDVYAEIEHDGELVAEVFAAEGHTRIAVVDLDGREMWVADLMDLHNALARACEALREAGLIE